MWDLNLQMISKNVNKQTMFRFIIYAFYKVQNSVLIQKKAHTWIKHFNIAY